MSKCTGCKDDDLILTPCVDKPDNPCGCTNKVDLLCSYYSGEDIEEVGIDKNMNGNLVIQILAEYIKNAFQDLDQDSIVLQSIGDGAVVYKGMSDEYIHEIKTIVQKDGVIVNETDDTIEFSVDTDWVRTVIENHLSQEWFTMLLKTIFNNDEFKEFFSQYITNLITGGDLNICELVKDCITQPETPNYPPTITGDITYNVANRGAAVNLSINDFLSRYYDPENDELVSIKITGGTLTNITKNGVPVTVGMIIPVAEIPQITFNTLNQDAAYNQTLLYVGLNELGQQTN